MNYLYIKFHIPYYNNSLATAIKLKAKYTFLTAILLFYILHPYSLEAS
jgi:hypothetical protein